jgi:hypothetical protein
MTTIMPSTMELFVKHFRKGEKSPDNPGGVNRPGWAIITYAEVSRSAAIFRGHRDMPFPEGIHTPPLGAAFLFYFFKQTSRSLSKRQTRLVNLLMSSEAREGRRMAAGGQKKRLIRPRSTPGPAG